MPFAAYRRFVIPLLRVAATVLGLVVLSGCDTFLGETDDGPPLPGTRIDVLTLDSGIEPDPVIADLDVVLPLPTVNSTWSQPGGNASHTPYHLALGPNPEVVWRQDVGEGSDDEQEILTQPVIVDGVVYTMDAVSIISAFQAVDGKQLWRTDLEDETEDDGFFGGGIAYENGRIFATTGFAKVFALDAQNGEIVWSAEVPGPVHGGPAVQDGSLYVITLDNQLTVLSTQDGRQLWNHVGLEEIASYLGTAAPAVQGDAVVVPYSSGQLLAFLTENGRVLWDESLKSSIVFDPLADIAQVRGLPVIDRGAVFAISHAGRMVAIDLRQGIRAWDIDVGGVQMPWVAGNFIFLVTNDSQLVCLRRDDGRVRWVQSLPRYEDEEDQTGALHWTGPVLAGDRLIVGGSNGTAISVSPFTGEILGSLELPDSVAVTPVVADNTLYFLTDNATLVALR
ncbi:MAG: PQQ-binding-like beta-propeller repeat protein [Pseudomonadota bacterium]